MALVVQSIFMSTYLVCANERGMVSCWCLQYRHILDIWPHRPNAVLLCTVYLAPVAAHIGNIIISDVQN